MISVCVQDIKQQLDAPSCSLISKTRIAVLPAIDRRFSRQRLTIQHAFDWPRDGDPLVERFDGLPCPAPQRW
jgi:hypothetical protein